MDNHRVDFCCSESKTPSPQPSPRRGEGDDVFVAPSFEGPPGSFTSPPRGEVAPPLARRVRGALVQQKHSLAHHNSPLSIPTFRRISAHGPIMDLSRDHCHWSKDRSGNGRNRSGTSDTSVRPARPRTCGRSWCSSSACRTRRSRRRGLFSCRRPRRDATGRPASARKPSRTCESSMHWISMPSGLCARIDSGTSRIEAELKTRAGDMAGAASPWGHSRRPASTCPRYGPVCRRQ